MHRVRNGIKIRYAVRKRNATSKTMRYDSSSYSIQQFLGAISHSLGAYTAAFDVVFNASDTEDDDHQQQQPTQQDESRLRCTGSSTTALNEKQSVDICQVCLMIAARTGVALVPCGHFRFCANTVPIQVVLHVFS